MQASIIIPTCNRAEQLFRCINSLVALDFDKSAFEIIVVDNGSNDNTKEVTDQYILKYPYHSIKYFYDNIPGLLTGRHRGAKEAKSDILIFVDDDIYADKGWLTAILETFNRFSDVHLVGGKCFPIYETSPPEWVDFFWHSLPDGGKILGELSLCDFGDDEKNIDPLNVWGLNFSIRKKSFIELGGFNPDTMPIAYQYLQGDGESGLSIKAIIKGYKAFYQPKALVYHEVPSERMTLGYFDKRYFFQGVCNSYTEIRKNNGIKFKFSILNFVNLTKNTLRPLYRLAFPIPVFTLYSGINVEKEMLLARFRLMERAGYNFHQEMVRKFPEVLKWVLKANYFDYELPKLGTF